jgi:arsenite oxidase large subunit
MKAPRLPETLQSPPDAPVSAAYKVVPTGCQYCVVGCGYEAHLWQKGTGADVPPREDQGNWVSPAMTEMVNLDGAPYVAAVLPDPKCPTNKGNHSSRGGTQGRDLVYQSPPGKSEPSAQRDSVTERVTTPYVRTRSGGENGFEPITTADATQIVAELVKIATDAQYDAQQKSVWFRRPEGLGVKIYEYQYLENTYAATKLFFQLIGTPNVAYHDRPSIASNTQGFGDSGIDPHGYAYADIWGSDVIFLAGINPYESQSVFFMQQMTGKRLIVLDPRRTITADYAVKTGGLHLQPNVLGADTLVLNALCRYVRDQWNGKDAANWGADRLRSGLIADAKSIALARKDAQNVDPDKGPDFPRRAQFHLSQDEFLGAFLDSQPDLAEAARVSGIPLAQLEEAARLLSGPADPMPPASQRKVSMIFEKGLIWGYSYHSTAAFANLGLMLGSVMDPTATEPQKVPDYGVTGRAGGHQKGWVEVRYDFKNARGAAVTGAGYPFYRATDEYVPQSGPRIRTHNYLDAHLVGTAVAPRDKRGSGPKDPDINLLWIIGSNAIGQIGNAAAKWQAVEKRRAGPLPASATVQEVVKVLGDRIRKGGLVIIQQDIYPNPTTTQADLVLPASGWGEEDFVRYNGERRVRLYGRFQDSPSYVRADGTREMRCQPDWKYFRDVANLLLPKDYTGHGLPAGYSFANASHPLGETDFGWKSSAEVFWELALKSSLNQRLRVLEDSAKPPAGHDLLRARGSRGWQLPLDKTAGGDITGTDRIRVKSDQWGPLSDKSKYGPYAFIRSDWNDIADAFKANCPRRQKHELAISNGRINELWNSLFTHIRNETVRSRYPDDMPGTILELSTADATSIGVKSGDIVDVVGEDIYPVGNTASFKGVVVVQPDVLRSGVAFAYFSYPASTARSPRFPYRTFTTDGYVNNITTGYVDPINPIAAVKFARGRIVPTGKQFPLHGPRGTLSDRPRHIAFGNVRVTDEKQRATWKLRELIVQKGLPRVRRHENALTDDGTVIADLMLEPDTYINALARQDAAGQKLRAQLAAAVSWMRWKVNNEVIDNWSAAEQASAIAWLGQLTPLP